MPTIVCYGDSNTYGYDAATAGRFPPDVRWPGVLRRELGAEFEVIEEGLNGRTTIWDDPFVDGRNGRNYLGPCLQSHAPIDVVVIMLGTNDLKAFFRVSAAEIASGAGALVGIVQTSRAGPGGGEPLVLLIAPPPFVADRGHAELWGFAHAEAESRRFPGLFARLPKSPGVSSSTPPQLSRPVFWTASTSMQTDIGGSAARLPTVCG
jgi:lysophospholipase L1-like esterase